MYLNRLNEEQKNLFIDLCIHASLANNNFADEEKNMIDELRCRNGNLEITVSRQENVTGEL